MQALSTLATTTFARAVSGTDTQVTLTSTSGIAPGVFLFANREVLKVVNLTPVANVVSVLRGQEGTMTRPHGSGESLYIARGDQLQAADPQGLPPAAVLVNPHINVANGTVWVVQGDDEGPGTQGRSWQQVTTTQAPGALGVRVTTTTTPS